MKKMISLLTSLSMLLSMGAVILPAHASITKSDIEGVDFDTYQFYYSLDEQGEYTIPHHVHTYYVTDSEWDNKGGVYYQTDYQTEDDYKYAVITLSNDTAVDALNAVLEEASTGQPVSPEKDKHIVYYYSPDVDYAALYAIEGVEKVEMARSYWCSRFFADVDDDGLISAHVYTEDDVVLTADMFPGYSVDSISRETDRSGEEHWVVKYKFENFKKSMEFDYQAEAIDGVISSDFPIYVWESSEEMMVPAATVESPQYGDFDRSGDVGAADASMILSYAAGQGNDDAASISKVASVFCDVDNSGTVDSVDASIILSYSAAIGNGSFTGSLDQYVDMNFPAE